MPSLKPHFKKLKESDFPEGIDSYYYRYLNTGYTCYKLVASSILEGAEKHYEAAKERLKNIIALCDSIERNGFQIETIDYDEFRFAKSSFEAFKKTTGSAYQDFADTLVKEIDSILEIINQQIPSDVLASARACRPGRTGTIQRAQILKPYFPMILPLQEEKSHNKPTQPAIPQPSQTSSQIPLPTTDLARQLYECKDDTNANKDVNKKDISDVASSNEIKTDVVERDSAQSSTFAPGFYAVKSLII